MKEVQEIIEECFTLIEKEIIPLLFGEINKLSEDISSELIKNKILILNQLQQLLEKEDNDLKSKIPLLNNDFVGILQKIKLDLDKLLNYLKISQNNSSFPSKLEEEIQFLYFEYQEIVSDFEHIRNVKNNPTEKYYLPDYKRNSIIEKIKNNRIGKNNSYLLNILTSNKGTFYIHKLNELNLESFFIFMIMEAVSHFKEEDIYKTLIFLSNFIKNYVKNSDDMKDFIRPFLYVDIKQGPTYKLKIKCEEAPQLITILGIVYENFTKSDRIEIRVNSRFNRTFLDNGLNTFSQEPDYSHHLLFLNRYTANEIIEYFNFLIAFSSSKLIDILILNIEKLLKIDEVIPLDKLKKMTVNIFQILKTLELNINQISKLPSYELLPENGNVNNYCDNLKDNIKFINSLCSVRCPPSYYNVNWLFKNNFWTFHLVNFVQGGTAGKSELKQDSYQNLKNMLTNSVNFTPSCSTFKINSPMKFVWSGSFGVILDYGYIYKSYLYDGNTIEVGNHQNKDQNVYRINIDEVKYFRENKFNKKNSELLKTQFSPYFILNLKQSPIHEFVIRNWTPYAIFYIKERISPDEMQEIINISKELSFKKYRNGEKFYRKIKIWNSKDDFVEKSFPVYEVSIKTGELKKIFEPKR